MAPERVFKQASKFVRIPKWIWGGASGPFLEGPESPEGSGNAVVGHFARKYLIRANSLSWRNCNIFIFNYLNPIYSSCEPLCITVLLDLASTLARNDPTCIQDVRITERRLPTGEPARRAARATRCRYGNGSSASAVWTEAGRFRQVRIVSPPAAEGGRNAPIPVLLFDGVLRPPRSWPTPESPPGWPATP